jgi:hypothetical protein
MDEIMKHVATHVTGDQGSGPNFTCNTTSVGSDTLIIIRLQSIQLPQ